MLGLCCCARISPDEASGGYSLMGASHCGGFCCCRAGTRAHRLQQPQLAGSGVPLLWLWDMGLVLHGMWKRPDQGLNSRALHWQADYHPATGKANHWTTREGPLLFLNEFIEIWLTHNELYILNVYSLMNLERVIHSWNEYHSCCPQKCNLKSLKKNFEQLGGWKFFCTEISVRRCGSWAH